jgi:replicative DNA helicase
MTPLHNLSAEQAVLGACLKGGLPVFETVAALTSASDFVSPFHRDLWATMTALSAQNQPLDVVTVYSALGDVPSTLGDIAALAKETPSAANAAHYAGIVRGLAARREILAQAQAIEALAYDLGKPVEAVMQEAQSALLSVATGQTARGWVAVKEAAKEAVDDIERGYMAESLITGVSTGFVDFDTMTSGLQPTDLIIVAGRPSMGKTSFAMQTAEQVAREALGPIAIFSLEMSTLQLTKRWLASLGRIDFGRVRTGKLEDDEFPRLTAAVNRLAERGIHIDDAPGLTIAQMRSKLRRLIAQHGNLGLVVVDYLQLMEDPASKGNRVQEVSAISRGLKAVAKEFNVPVIALSQLSRELERRIVFLYRDEVYNEDSPDRGIAEIIIGKQRNGPLGTVRLTFSGQFTRFDNFTQERNWHEC